MPPALAGVGGFLGGAGAGGGGAVGGGFAPELAALVGGGVVGGLAAAAAPGVLAALVVLVDGGPGPALGFLPGNPALLVALLDVVGLALLLVGVLVAGHVVVLPVPVVVVVAV